MTEVSRSMQKVKEKYEWNNGQSTIGQLLIDAASILKHHPM